MINTFGWMRVNDDFCIYFYFYFFIIYKVKALRLCVLDTGGKDVHVKMCVYIYIYIYIGHWGERPSRQIICMYVVHTYYVLTNPPIPSSRSKHFIFLRPNFFTSQRANPRTPLVTTLIMFFIFGSNHIVTLFKKYMM